ncbi:site-2 protease family protein [Streptomyces sp. BB1-1-1]|uniref:site-2 protease family protein n=1 Tax=Streptomyces sp. BB1-1-1 TaxID=3074430 RepID=UPI00287807FF|nr:site-2 protease family protein [Streptomyces sp. BB1-1-1]WND38495.1 site-2 protease family protein [Streptomyces sp. BB1-1-1]
MDVSGGSGQPRSGNDESAEPQAGPTAPAAEPAQPGPADSSPPEQTPGRPSQGPETPGRPSPDPETPDPETPGRPSPGPETLRKNTAGATARNEPAPNEPARNTPQDPAPAPTPPPNSPSPSREADPVGSPRRPVPEHAGAGDAQGGQAPGGDGAGQPSTGPSVNGAGSPDGREAHTKVGPGPGRPPQRKPEPGGGLLMGRPFGVPVYVAPSWFLVAALITWVFGGQLDRVLPGLGGARYLVALFFAVAFYASVLVHELAHTVAALRFKLPVRRIQLQFFGGVSEIEKEAETPGREFVLAFVGPVLSLVLAGVFYAALLPVEPDSVPGVLLAGLMVSNLLVAAFNLLPGLPLDGGRMLRAVVWKITGKPMHGTIAAAWVGRALAIAVLVGLPLLTQSLGSGAADDVGMDTVLDALLAAILAAIIWTGAGNSLRMARLREHLPELRARALTRRAVPVPADTPLSEALRRANASGARALVVVDGDGTPVSLVREAAIVGVPEHRRPWVAVSTLAQDLTDGMRLSAELSGEELLDALRANPATEYLVVEETGEIYGVLSAADVERAFVKAMARPS